MSSNSTIRKQSDASRGIVNYTGTANNDRPTLDTSRCEQFIEKHNSLTANNDRRWRTIAASRNAYQLEAN